MARITTQPFESFAALEAKWVRVNLSIFTMFGD
jgi:hypothetical protein